MKSLRPLGGHYRRAMQDPNLLELNAELGLTDARVSEQLEAAAKAGTPQALDERWPAILELIEQRRKLVESAVRRQKDLRMMITAEQFRAFGDMVLSSIRNTVKDRETLAALAAEMRRLFQHDRDELGS